MIFGDDRRAEYVDAVLRVSAIRWGAVTPAPQAGALILAAAPGDPGQTCVALKEAHRARAAGATLHLRDRVDGLGTGDPQRPGAGARGAATRELARTLGVSREGRRLDGRCDSRPERTIPRKAMWSLPASRPARGAFSLRAR